MFVGKNIQLERREGEAKKSFSKTLLNSIVLKKLALIRIVAILLSTLTA